jgi:hypothetical protein
MRENFTTKKRLSEQFAGGDDGWLSSIHLKIVNAFEMQVLIFSTIRIDENEDRVASIHDDSFVVPVSDWNYQLSWRNSWRNLFLKEHKHKFRILGIKTSMLGGDVQEIYQKRNKEVIEQIGFRELLKKEQAILTMIINQSIEKGAPKKYLKPLGYECIAERKFHLFLCDEKYKFNRDDILKARYECSRVFNCTNDNNPDEDSFHFVGGINMKEVDRLHHELRGSFS